MIRIRTWACALALPALVSLAAAQTPLPSRQQGAAASAPASATPSGGAGRTTLSAAPAKRTSAVSPVSPIAPPVDPAAAGRVTGKVGTFAADRLSSAAASSSALVPTATRWVPVTIVNRAGGRVPSLKLDDVGIIEDGVRQRATAIERWPLWLTIVLDVSRQIGSAKQLAVHRQLVYDLLYALGEDDHVSVVQYADGIELIQPWTSNARDAEQAVEARFESGLEGQLWDSVSYASENLLADKLGRKVVVVITDGVDDASQTASYDHAVDLLHSSSTTLYILNLSRYLEEQIRREAYGVNGVINVIQSPSYIGRRKELRQYADKLGEAPQKMVRATNDSGGKLWLVAPDEDPANLPRLIWQQLDGQYAVSYVPERDGDARSTRAIRSMKAFVTRGDIEARAPDKLFVPVVPPRSGPTGTHLRKN